MLENKDFFQGQFINKNRPRGFPQAVVSRSCGTKNMVVFALARSNYQRKCISVRGEGPETLRTKLVRLGSVVLTRFPRTRIAFRYEDVFLRRNDTRVLTSSRERKMSAERLHTS